MLYKPFSEMFLKFHNEKALEIRKKYTKDLLRLVLIKITFESHSLKKNYSLYGYIIILLEMYCHFIISLSLIHYIQVRLTTRADQHLNLLFFLQV